MAKIKLPKKLISKVVVDREREHQKYAKGLYQDFLTLRSDGESFRSYLIKRYSFSSYKAKKYSGYVIV